VSRDLEVPRTLTGAGGWLDDRFHGARGMRVLMRKVFPDHWSFLLGEIALWSFVILLLTGTFLSLFFVPSMTEVTYHGSYVKLNGITMSEAYQSTLRISFDVRGGLLIRQVHHWAADLFMAAILAHMLRVFFTGAYRKPREVNWLIGIGLFTLGLLEGLFGYSLPDDQLSGAGLRVFEGILQGIPVVGTYLAFFLFGGPFPGHDIVPRMYILHVLLIPGLLLALISAHLFIMFHQKHTQMPAKGNTERNVVGQPFYPYFIAKGTTWFFFIFAALALMAAFAQINPVWLYGPYSPVAISSASQPDFYMGLLEGSLRIMPAWEVNFLGHTVTFSALIPFVLPLTIVLGEGGAVAVIRTMGHGGQVRSSRQRPAAERAGADRCRRGRDDVLWRAVGRGRQRRDRQQAAGPAVHDHLDRAGPDVRWTSPRLRHHETHLPGPAAQGPRGTATRLRVGHRQATAQRRVHRSPPAGERGEAGDAQGQEGARAARARHRGRQRRARPVLTRGHRQAPGAGQPRLRRDHRGRGRLARQRSRPRPGRGAGYRGFSRRETRGERFSPPGAACAG
jgi:quinol-cytochrome oxidoreductase complex cytochrome b subunit